jgi:predicted Zn finger-like uncharacterized protein
MTLECPNCRARYNIQDSLIPTQGARVKCKKCASVITIPPPVVELAPQDLELIPPSPAPPSKAPAPPSFNAPAPGSFNAPAPSPRPPVPPDPPAPPDAPAPFERGFARESVQESSAVDGIQVDRPFEGASSLPPADPQFERAGAPTHFGSPPPFGQSPSAPPMTREPLPGLDTTLAMQAPAVAEDEEPVPTPEPEAPSRATSPSDPAQSEFRAGLPSGTPIPAGLSPEDQSKHEKARRLARVLASDIAIYNRDKRDRGIREGNLVAMLGYEIKKSWEIYKERVGTEFANSTPYFRDALNEMLAEGKKIF